MKNEDWTRIESKNNSYIIGNIQKAFNIIGNINENEQIKVDVILKTTGNQKGDIYYNMATCQTLKNNAQVESVFVKTQVGTDEEDQVQIELPIAGGHSYKAFVLIGVILVMLSLYLIYTESKQK